MRGAPMIHPSPTNSAWLNEMTHRIIQDMSQEYRKESGSHKGGYELQGIGPTPETITGDREYGMTFPLQVKDLETGQEDQLHLRIDLHLGAVYISNGRNRVSGLYELAFVTKPVGRTGGYAKRA